MKKIFIVKLSEKIKEETISNIPPKGKIIEILPIKGVNLQGNYQIRELNENEEVYIVESAIMHRICQVFSWDYSLMIDHEFKE